MGHSLFMIEGMSNLKWIRWGGEDRIKNVTKLYLLKTKYCFKWTVVVLWEKDCEAKVINFSNKELQ